MAGLGRMMRRVAKLKAIATQKQYRVGLADGECDQGEFIARCQAMEAPRVLELGTKRANPSVSTMHRDWVPGASEYLGVDIEDGLDVDVVADVHSLSHVVGREEFDAVISCSTFEHFKYPHLAAHEIIKSLKVGGLLFIQTHQTFPLHAYPYDYFRFSREALSGLFGTKMGFKVLSAYYDFPAHIVSRREPALVSSPAYLNTILVGEKTGPTPEVYAYELDSE